MANPLQQAIERSREIYQKATGGKWLIAHFQSGTVCVLLGDSGRSVHVNGTSGLLDLTEQEYQVQRLADAKFIATSHEMEPKFREAAAVMAEALPDLIHWAKRGLEDIESVTATALLETAITRVEIAIAKTNALFEEAPHD